MKFSNYTFDFFSEILGLYSILVHKMFGPWRIGDLAAVSDQPILAEIFCMEGGYIVPYYPCHQYSI